MIDFNESVVKEHLVPEYETLLPEVQSVLTADETILACFRGQFYGVFFTDWRLIAVYSHGVFTKKKKLTTLPYSSIRAFAVDTEEDANDGAHLQLWLEGLGRQKFSFHKKTDIIGISKTITQYCFGRV